MDDTVRRRRGRAEPPVGRTLTSRPVEICELGRDGVLRLDRLFELYSMHDAVLVAAHHTHETTGILTNDHEIEQYDGDAVVWS